MSVSGSQLHFRLSASESDDALLKVSVPRTDSATPALPDFSRMTEDEQIAYALQMSMQGAGAGKKQSSAQVTHICCSCMTLNISKLFVLLLQDYGTMSHLLSDEPLHCPLSKLF